MKPRIWIAITTIIFCACHKDQQTNPLNSSDRAFVLNASMANRAEIDAGQLAAVKGNDESIIDFGRLMITEHTAAKTELKAVADRLQIYAPDSLDAAHSALKTQLLSLTGRAFDSVYIHAQVKDHQNAIALFQDEIRSGSDSQLINYANAQVPHLQVDLQKADSIAAHF